MDKVTELCLQEPESNSYCTLGSQNQMVTEQDCETLLLRLQDSKRASSRLSLPPPRFAWYQDISVSTCQEPWGCQHPAPHSGSCDDIMGPAIP